MAGIFDELEYLYEERAAIYEYEAGMSREEAEAKARADIFGEEF